MTKNKIPVTIVTGFLGAGKTTLLNGLIEAHPQTKFAIIENEFGDIPIDQELVINAKDGIFEMSNGCICCSLNTELGELLRKLSDDAYQFDHLIIETTGIAEPDGIAAAFVGANKATRFYLDGTICLADARDIVKNLQERGEAIKQVSFADLIVLNKTDLVDMPEREMAIAHIKKFNAEAPVIETQYGKLPPESLKLQAYDGLKLENTLLNPQHHHHHNELVAHSFEFGAPLLADKFEHWINMLLFLSGYQIYRIKGILQLEGESHKVVFQSVRSNSKIDLGSQWQPGEIRKSKIVFIGHNIKKEPLEKGLKGCMKRT
ncbi:MAG: GTP-binding protein [Cyclobacteriaceae bacterium]|nr:GTP-binding protein [Cyclobacteriaceae bacterium]